MSEIIIYGAGGHSKVILENIQCQGRYTVVAFIDTNPDIKEFCGLPVHQEDEMAGLPQMGIIGIGDNYIRSKIADEIAQVSPHFKFINAIHPQTTISKNIELGVGITIMAGAVLNPGTTIGDHSIINTQCSIDHDCNLGKYSAISPGAIVGGTVNIGDYSVISIGATVRNNTSIGKNTIIGAGAVLVNDIGDDITAVGVPAKEIKKRKLGDKYLS